MMSLIKILISWIDHEIGLDCFDEEFDFELEASDLS
jgi:hypothetical protein